MTKGKDNSEQVRIRTEYAEYIRGESTRLGKNFLSTLYWMIDNYRDQRSNGNSTTSANITRVEHTIKENTNQVQKTSSISDEDVAVNTAEFE